MVLPPTREGDRVDAKCTRCRFLSVPHPLSPLCRLSHLCSGDGYGGYYTQQQQQIAWQRQQQALAQWQAAQQQAPAAEPGLAPSSTADKPLALQAWLEEKVRTWSGEEEAWL